MRCSITAIGKGLAMFLILYCCAGQTAGRNSTSSRLKSPQVDTKPTKPASAESSKVEMVKEYRPPGETRNTKEVRETSEVIGWNNLSGDAYAVLTISDAIKGLSQYFYTIRLPDGTTKELDDPSAVLNEAADWGRRTSGGYAFLVARDLNYNRLLALRTTLRNSYADQPVSLVFSGDGSLARIMEKAPARSEIRIREKAEFQILTTGATRFEQIVVLHLGDSTKRMTVRARLAEWIDYFLMRLKTLLASAGATDHTLASLVLQARADLKARFQISDEELQREFRVNIGRTQIVVQESLPMTSTRQAAACGPNGKC